MAPTLLELAHWSTWAVCAVIKLPQLAAVLTARSARGVSVGSVLLELAGFLVFLRYQIYYGYPLQTYLEYPIIIAQDVILLLFILRFNGNMKRALFYAVTYPLKSGNFGLCSLFGSSLHSSYVIICFVLPL
uniref:Solute carrier family 66 member 3 n=1 Tax=Strix occidentalis caurina TaxID=311401 RepID=A0A8D0FU92_STROC